ncbi:MAG: hypothetical protein R3F20_17095, partial [Planctomycetota bacterium]
MTAPSRARVTLAAAIAVGLAALAFVWWRSGGGDDGVLSRGADVLSVPESEAHEGRARREVPLPAPLPPAEAPAPDPAPDPAVPDPPGPLA